MPPFQGFCQVRRTGLPLYMFFFLISEPGKPLADKGAAVDSVYRSSDLKHICGQSLVVNSLTYISA